MPELPETETIARQLHEALGGSRIVLAAVYRPDVLREIDSELFVLTVTGSTFERFWRRAKSIVADLSTGERVVVTPRFTGGLFIDEGAMQVDGADYTALQFRLNDGRTLRYRDVRRLGTVAVMSAARFDAWSALIGPDALDPKLTPKGFSGFIRATKRPIKTVLMDQRVIAGVGNIYANEALWSAGILPTRPAAELSDAESRGLLSGLRKILRASIKVGGTTFRDYRDPSGGRGRYVAQLKVYGRAGELCPRCGTVLASHHDLEKRVSVFCPGCQR